MANEFQAAINAFDGRLADTAAELLNLILESTRMRGPEQFAAVERLRVLDALDLRLQVVVPAADPTLLRIDVILTERDGRNVMRIMGMTAKLDEPPAAPGALN